MTTEIKDLFAVKHMARYMAKKRVEAELRDQGLRVSLVRPAEINTLATAYLAAHPELYDEAFARFEKPRR
jgi:NAD(P)-dependent dehydrogenase (short-subunit alcohol dehydrogenase family)